MTKAIGLIDISVRTNQCELPRGTHMSTTLNYKVLLETVRRP